MELPAHAEEASVLEHLLTTEVVEDGPELPNEVATPVKGLRVRVCSGWVESGLVTIRALNREYVLDNTPRLPISGL